MDTIIPGTAAGRVETGSLHLAKEFSINRKRSLCLSLVVMLVLLCASVHAQSNALSDILFKAIYSPWTHTSFDAYNHRDLPTLGAMGRMTWSFITTRRGCRSVRLRLLRRSSRTSAVRWSGRLCRAPLPHGGRLDIAVAAEQNEAFDAGCSSFLYSYAETSRPIRRKN